MPTLGNKSGLKSWATKPKAQASSWSDDEGKRFYNSSEWRNCRKSYMDANPLCEVSKSQSRYHAGKECDHIIPVRFGGARFHPQNLLSLTVYYHRRKTGLEKAKGQPLVHFVETEWGLLPKNKDEIMAILKR